MTRTTTEKLTDRLRVLHQLTISESQVAQSRQVQACNDHVRQQFTANAAEAQQRAKLIAAALRELGGVTDVITPALGRNTALLKTVVEQGPSLTGALLGYLALEHQLLDCARYVEVLADAAGHVGTRLLAQRVQVAHREGVEWITSVLAEEVAGKPTAVQPTQVRKAVGRLTSAANYPTRWASARINETAAAAARTRSRVASVTEATVEFFSVGRDAELHQAEQIPAQKGARTNAGTLHLTHGLNGGLTKTQLTVDHYDDLTVNEVADVVQKRSEPAALDTLLRYVLSDPPARDALLRYTRNLKDSAGGVLR